MSARTRMAQAAIISQRDRARGHLVRRSVVGRPVTPCCARPSDAAAAVLQVRGIESRPQRRLARALLSCYELIRLAPSRSVRIVPVAQSAKRFLAFGLRHLSERLV